MKQRTAILIAAALTSFVLVLAGSLVFAVNSKDSSAAASFQPEPAIEQVVNQADPTAAPTSAPPTFAPSPAQVKPVSVERAAQIALRLLPGSILQQPAELVNYKGKMAYEVMLNVATVYVDAFNGAILGSVPVTVGNQLTGDSGGNGGASYAGDSDANGDDHDDDGGHDDDGPNDDNGHDNDANDHNDDGGQDNDD